MTSLKRTRKAIRMEKIDRIPTFPILIAPACQLIGVKQRDYSLDSQVMTDTLIRARDLIGTDGIYVSRDNWVYHQALGGSMIFPEDDEPYSRKTVLSSLKSKTNKPNIASFLLLTTGILGVFTAVIYGSKEQPIFAELHFFTDMFSQTFEPAVFSVILIIFSLCAFIGSLTSHNRRYYLICLICALIGVFSIGFFVGSILSIIAFIILLFSKDEFENGSKIRIF